METAEHGLTCGAFVVARRLGVCGHRAVVDFVLCFRCGGAFVIFFHRTDTACCTHVAALPHSPLY